MIKHTVSAFLFWITVLLLVLSVMFFANSIVALALVVIWFVFPLITYVTALFAAKNISVLISADTVSAKKRQIKGTVRIENTGLLPVIKVFCNLEMQNRLTGEKTYRVISMSAAASATTTAEVEFASEYCGYLQLTVKEIYLMDIFGFLPLKKKVYAKAGTSVLPDTFPTDVNMSISVMEKPDSNSWSPYKKGNDPSELFSLRDYARGDSLKQIHWKMSAKKNQLIVKEYSIPVEKSMLIYWNKNIEGCSAAEMDAMAECVSSVAQAVINNGISFALGWTDGTISRFENIDTEEQLITVIPQMLKSVVISGVSAISDEEKHRYSKIIYIAKKADETVDGFICEDKTLLLMDKATSYDGTKIIYFTAENYMEDLQFVEL